jgi:uncharacterized membrane protein YsdA (DUF1294 family)
MSYSLYISHKTKKKNIVVSVAVILVVVTATNIVNHTAIFS